MKKEVAWLLPVFQLACTEATIIPYSDASADTVFVDVAEDFTPDLIVEVAEDLSVDVVVDRTLDVEIDTVLDVKTDAIPEVMADVTLDVSIDITQDQGFDLPPAYIQPNEGQVIFTELMVDSAAAIPPPGLTSDDVGEWVELYNTSDETFDLRGCNLSDSKNTDVITTSVIVAPGELVALSRSAPGFSPDFIYAAVKFSDTGDLVKLTCGVTTIDIVNFNGFVLLQGHTLNLNPNNFNNVENDLDTNWCLAKTVYNVTSKGVDYGTPRLMNTTCP